MAEPIGFQDGIEAVRQRLHAVDTGNTPEAGYDKLLGEPGVDYGLGPVEGTINKLKDGHNEFEQRITAIEQTLLSRPF